MMSALRAQIESLKDMQKLLEETANSEEAKHKDLLLVMRMLGFAAQPPKTLDDLANIADAYHELTGKYVDIGFEEGGLGVNFGDEPFKAKQHEPEPASVATAKPLTKSQQRRRNAQKGFGAITDDELREKRLAERRAKRQAKKATAPTSTTTTTLPGQTSLTDK